jgi:hypothetical protein
LCPFLVFMAGRRGGVRTEGSTSRRAAAAQDAGASSRRRSRASARDERRSREQSLPLRHMGIQLLAAPISRWRQQRSGDNAPNRGRRWRSLEPRPTGRHRWTTERGMIRQGSGRLIGGRNQPTDAP